MSSAASLPHPAEQADQQAEDAQYYRRVLHELIDMGVDLARDVHRQATAQAENPASTAVHAAVAFDRISRAVRRTVALARKVAEPLPTYKPAGQDRVAARRRILREVEDVIQRKADGADAEALQAELCERLDAPELEDDIGDRPVAEIIADICRDLGLAAMPGTRPWKRRTPQDIEALCACAAQPPGAGRAAQPGADQPQAPSPVVAQAVPRHDETWADPPSYSREASIELMQRLLHLTPRCRDP